jgi:hypothetical protein
LSVHMESKYWYSMTEGSTNTIRQNILG